ncbi:MAG: hypothetical protein ACTSPW_00035 [Promethearchaeota archaeon]
MNVKIKELILKQIEDILNDYEKLKSIFKPLQRGEIVKNSD